MNQEKNEEVSWGYGLARYDRSLSYDHVDLQEWLTVAEASAAVASKAAHKSAETNLEATRVATRMALTAMQKIGEKIALARHKEAKCLKQGDKAAALSWAQRQASLQPQFQAAQAAYLAAQAAEEKAEQRSLEVYQPYLALSKKAWEAREAAKK